jgi:hypothetical protein
VTLPVTRQNLQAHYCRERRPLIRSYPQEASKRAVRADGLVLAIASGMPNAPTLLSVARIAPPPPAGAARSSAPAFSFEAAVAALERQSSQSLDIHGGAPATALTAVRSSTGAADAPARNGSPPAENAAARPADTAPAPIGADQPPPRQAAPAPAQTSIAAAAAPPPVLAPRSISQAPPQTSVTGAAAVRGAAARPGADAARAPALARTPPAAVKQFAEILAQRLEHASQFDLRLDPPALGSVEGRLTLSDDGQALLALSFDNPSAYDLFQRDEAALRSAFADAGFDLGGRNLQFSFREPARAAIGAEEPHASSVIPAPRHRGAVDIRA